MVELFKFAVGVPASNVKRSASKSYPTGASRYPYNTGLIALYVSLQLVFALK